MNRRKLGTSRRNKGRQRVKEPETGLGVESREDVQDEARGSECPDAQMSAAKQPKELEEVGQECDHSMAAQQEAFLVGTDGKTDGDKIALCSEDTRHILISRDVNTPFTEETKLEDYRTNTHQNEKFSQNLYDHLPEVTSYTTSNQQMIEQGQDINLCSVAESYSIKLVYQDLFRPDGFLQDNFSVSELNVNTPITPQITADNAQRENIPIIDGINQDAFLLQKETLLTSKDGNTQCSDEVEYHVYRKNNLTQVQSEHQNENSAEDPLKDEECNSYSEKQILESDTCQSMLPVSTTVKTDISNTAEEIFLGQMDRTGSFLEDNRQIVEKVHTEKALSENKRNKSFVPNLESDLKASTEPQLQDSSQTTDEHAESDFSFNATKRKMGSSFRNEGKWHAKEPEEETYENTWTNAPQVFSKVKETEQEELSVDTADMNMSLSQKSLVSFSLVPSGISSEDLDKNSQIMKSENPQKGQDETSPLALFEVTENSDVSQHEVDQSYTLHSQDMINCQSENVLRNLFQEIKNETEDDMKRSTDQIFHQEKHPVLLEFQPLEAFRSVNEQSNEGSNQAFYSSGNRRKLGSSRKIKEKQQEKDSKEKSRYEINTHMLDKEKMSSEANIYTENEEVLIPEGVKIPEHQYKSETEMNMEFPDKKWEDTSECQSGTFKSKSGIHQTKEGEVPYSEDNERQGQVHKALQTQGQEPQQMNYIVYGQMGEGRVCLEDPKNYSAHPQLQDNSLSTDKQTDVSRRKLGSSRRKKARQQVKEPATEVFDSTGGDQIQETASMLKEELSQNNEPRIPETDLQGLIVKCENLQEHHYENRLDSKNTVKVSQRGVEEIDTLCNKNTTDAVAVDAPREVVGVEMGNYSDAKDETNQDSVYCCTNKPQIKDVNTKGVASNDFEEFKGGEEYGLQHIKSLTSYQVIHKDKKGFSSELEEIKVVPSNILSEIDYFDSRPQEMPDTVDEQTKTSFESSDHNIKKDYSQSSEGRQHDEKSEDVKEKSKEVQNFVSTQILSESKTVNQEELGHDVERDVSPVLNDSSVFTPGDLSEIQSFPENDLVNSTSENVYFTKYQERSETEGNALVDASEMLQSQKCNSPEDSYDTIKQAQNYTDPPTDIQQSQQMDNWSEIVAHNVSRYQVTVLEDMIDQAEITSSIQSELTVKSDDSDTKLDLLPENQQYLCFTTEGNEEAVVPTTDDHLCDSKETLASSVVRVNNALGHMDKGGSQVQNIEHNHADATVADSSLSTDKQTEVGFNYSGSRKKLGSSRRNKQRKEYTQETLETTGTEETIDTATLLFDTKATRQEELSKDNEDEVTLSASRDLSIIPVLSSEDQSSVETKGPDKHLKTLIVVCENLQEDTNERNSNVLSPDQEKSVDLSLSKYKAIHCEDTRDVVLQETVMKDQEEKDCLITEKDLQICLRIPHSSETASDDTTKNADMYGSLTDQGEMSPLTEKSTDSFTAKEEEHPEKEIISEILDLKNEEMVQNNNKNKDDDIFLHDKEEPLFEKEESKPIFSNIEPEIFSLYPHTEETSKSVDEHFNTDFSNCTSGQKVSATLLLSDVKTDTVEEQRQDVEQNMTLLVSNENSTLSPPSDSSKVQSAVQNIYPETDLTSLIKEDSLEKVDKSEKYNVDLSHKSEEDSFVDKTDFVKIKGETLQTNQITGPNDLETARKQSHDNEDQPTDIARSEQKEVAHELPKYTENNLKEIIEQVEIISSIQSDFEVKSNDGSDTKQELPHEVQQNLCFKTEANVETLAQTNKDDHLYDSKEGSISSLAEENNTLSQTNKDVSLVQATEHSLTDPKLQDSSFSTDEQTDLGFSGIRRKLGSSRRNKGRHDVKEPTQVTSENTLRDNPLQTSMPLEKSGAEQEDLTEDIEHKIILSLSQDLCLMPLHVMSSEDSNCVLKKDPTCRDGSESRLEVEMIGKPINVVELEEGQFDTIHCKVTKDAGSDDAFREVEDVRVHQTEMQDTLQSKCYSDITAENKGIIPENLADPAEMSELTVKITDGSATKEEVYHRKENYPEAIDVKDKESDLYDLNIQQITNLGKGDSAPDEMVKLNGKMEGESSMQPDVDPKCLNIEINSESQNKLDIDVILSLQSGDDSLLDISDSLESEDHTFCNKVVIGTEHESSMHFDPSLVQSLEVQSSMPDIYPENGRENLIQEVEVEEYPGQSWENSEHQSDTLHSESGILQAKNRDNDEGQGQQHEARTQVQQPHQMDHIVYGQVEEGRLFLEDSENHSANPQPQDNSLSTDKQTDVGFGFTGSRRKLGSSRRNKGRQQGKEPPEEVLESKRGTVTLERPTVPSQIGRAEQEEMKEDTKHVNISVSHDNISICSIPPVMSFENQSSVLSNYPEKDLQSLILKSENLEEDLNERKSPAFAQDEAKSADVSIDESDSFNRGDHSNTVSDNGKEMLEAVKSTQIQESIQTCSYNDFKGDATEHLDITSENPTDQAELSEHKTNIVDEIEIKEESYSSEEINSDVHELKNEETAQHDVRTNTDEIFHQDQEHLLCETGYKTLGLSNFPSENIFLNLQPQELSESVDNQTKSDLHSSGSRRKLGSSRRNKGRVKAIDSAALSHDQTMKGVDINASINEKTKGREAPDQEKSIETVLDELEEKYSSICITGIQPSPTVDHKVIDTSCCTQSTDREPPKPLSIDHYECRELCMQDDSLKESILSSEPHACPPTTERYAEKSRSTEPESRDVGTFEKVLKQHTKPAQNQGMFRTIENERDGTDGNHDDYSRNMFEHAETKVTDDDAEILKPNAPPEKAIEKPRSMYLASVDYSIGHGAVSSPQEMCSTDGGKDRLIAAETHNFIDVESKEQKEQAKNEQMQETHQVSLQIDECHVQTRPSDKEVESLKQTQQSDKDATLDSQPKDAYQSLKDDAHSGPTASAYKRKLGSSRRHKGRKNNQVTEKNEETENEAQENTTYEETAQMLAAQEEEIEKEILSENLAPFRLTEILLKDNIVSSHDVLEDSTSVTSGYNPNSIQVNLSKSNAEEKDKDVKLTDGNNDSIQLTGHDTNKKSLMQSTQGSVWIVGSDMQNTLFHNDIISPEPENVHVIVHEEALQRQNRDTSSEKAPPGRGFHLQNTNKEIETVGFVTTEDCISEVESLMDVHDLKQDEEGKKCMHEAQEKNTSNECISASQEPAVDESNKEGISATVKAPNSQGENPQLTLKQKKRKLGSSRRTPLNRKREDETQTTDETEERDFSTKTEMGNRGELEGEGEVPLKLEVLQGDDMQPQQETLMQQEISDSLQTNNNDISFSSEKSAIIDPIIETPNPDGFKSTEIQMTPELVERNSCFFNQPMTSNNDTQGGSPEVLCELPQNKQGDEQSPQNVEVKQVQDIQKQSPSRKTEGIHTQNPGIENTSQDLIPTNRRRKMGSTRKNLGIQTKQEIFEPENGSAEIVTSSRDVTVSSDSGKKETEPQLHTEHIDANSQQGKEKETLEISQFGESLLRALAEDKAEENSISEEQTAEAEQQENPSGLPPSPPTSETASGGRRKKFGSNRKSGLQQRKPEKTAENEDEARGITEGGAHKATERDESSGLSKISEVDENEGKVSPCTNLSETTEFPKPVRDKTPGTLVHGSIQLNEEAGTSLSFGTTSGTNKSDCYNVVMVGESCVGKTSFMKRAQSGKFSLDLPASVGLDSCKWTVVVDGKPVVLQLWDTAGQERFHSITKQVFHKAHAFLLMYDITSSQSFSAVSYWANSIQEAAAEDVTVLLLGNKSEHAKRQVKTAQGDILAKEYNFEFMECSAATGENVIEALETVARMLSHRTDLLREEVTVLHKEPTKRRSKCC
ncbi:titin homolog [Cyprinodon tularosa]|uniref:titin homolog n=1 Tax=Cyprinodon tularosa TaxID=77115 RepID=UPI0018E21CD1|nr:titin homolog [Cyprinodon tularosa]